ncbi:GntR family transcriptional regulator [Nocardia sp. CS682]|uniref:GntR family transcriptional regulator n=1 Tax=Nocardia sp. CS682 TaxID=1047172 RepID=UPI001074D601|nr:GntR family transcriptional regulator [Nocardia sp. CS682]QBS39517.1 GntR family transcriptional regulator [Nocardia sp. CS682]
MLWHIDQASRVSLQDQIAACVRRAVTAGELVVNEQLPPATELAHALSVDRNTVLAAYRRLREEGVVDFRRGRGVRVTAAAPTSAPVEQAVRQLIESARANGYSKAEVLGMIEELM